MSITDYKNVKEQMMDMIFHKKVKYDQDLFDAYYDRMFPASEELRKLLETSGRDIMQDAAKKIADRLLYESVWNGTQFLFDNLLAYETKNLAETEKAYVPQDHAVHSVQLYLLGIYCYFHFSVFHDALFDYFSEINIKSDYSYTAREKAFWGFLEAWKTFSLMHDVAYPFETLINKDGKISEKKFALILQKYSFMSEYMCYYASMDYFSGLVLLYTLIKNSEHELETELEDECDNFIEEKNGKSFYGYARGKGNGYRKLRGIYFNEDYKKYSQYFGKDECVILIKNQFYDKIGLFLRRDTKSLLFVRQQLDHDTLEQVKRIERMSRLEVKRCGLHIEFYIPTDINEVLGKKMSNVNIWSRMPEVEKASRRVEERLSIDFSALSEKKNISDLQYKIMKYLSEKCPPENCIPARSFTEAMPESVLKNRKEMLRKTIVQEVRIFMDDLMKDYQDTLKTEEMTELFRNIRKIDLDELSLQIEGKYNEQKLQRDDDVLNVIEVLQKILHEFSEVSEKNKQNDQKLVADIYKEYREQTDHDFKERIYRLLRKEKFLQTGDDIDIFLGYRTGYSRYDHGIAAGILASVYYNRRRALDECVKQKEIPVPKNYDFEAEAVMEQAIYAILVHNVYTGQYKSGCGRTPEHTLMLNPLSYYGMFCDNLQVWDRNKGINFGLVKWKGRTLYGEDISICFENDKIQILCRTNDIEVSFYKLKASLEEYLVGSSKLISLNLIENE